MNIKIMFYIYIIKNIRNILVLNNMQEKKDLKARVYEILQKHNIKQVDLAREIGIHHSTLSLWMQNKNKGTVVMCGLQGIALE